MLLYIALFANKWYQEAVNDRGVEMSKAEGREAFYGMPFEEWKEKYQTEAPKEKLEVFAEAIKQHEHCCPAGAAAAITIDASDNKSTGDNIITNS